MWLSLFLGFACLIVIIRLVLFSTGTGSFDDRLGKAKNWLFGLVLLSISWFVLSKIFGVGNGSLKIGNSGNDMEVNSDNFKKPKEEQDNPNGVPIVLD
jgi:hypothetical protein